MENYIRFMIENIENKKVIGFMYFDECCFRETIYKYFDKDFVDKTISELTEKYERTGS